ncbi:MAG: ABC transporter permease [Thermotogaceae bacterium]|nr:ABC transporter permease [Thermotogaceae bacterium]
MVVIDSICGSEREGILFNYFVFFKDHVSRTAYLRSIRIGLWVTGLSAIISYPTALAIASINNRTMKTVFMTLMVLPLMTNPVARTFAWLAVLGRYGLLNNLLLSARIIEEPVRMLYTEGAVLIGLLQLFMPMMILSISSALENIPEDLSLAARSLGASGFQTFARVTFPLSVEGLITGGTLVFTGSITAYVTPAILGGSRVLMLSTLLYQKAAVILDWDIATTIAVMMFLTTLLINTGLRSIGKVGRR